MPDLDDAAAVRVLHRIKMTPDAIRCRVERGKSFSLSRNAWSMEQLQERQRTNVYPAYFEDLSRGEIGRIVDCEENAVRQYLCQALRKLKGCLAASGLQ
jgi:DNA-directed RNA polymerase specialized sigma subunit